MGLKTMLGLKRKKMPAPRPKAGSKRTADYLSSYGFSPATVIDVGVASKGTLELYDAYPHAELLLIDPLEEGRQVAEHLVSDGRNARFVQVAAGAQSGTVTINRHGDDAKSSAFEWISDRADGVVSKVQSPLATLDKIASEAEGPLGIKIDVEGYELEVLQGAVDTLKRAQFAIVECSVQRRLRGGPLCHEIIGFMAGKGFGVVDILNASARRRPRHMDIVFAPLGSVLFAYDHC